MIYIIDIFLGNKRFLSIKKTVISLFPELYLLAATFYYWFSTANLLNPFAIGLLLIISYQIVFKKITSGLIISLIFILLNLYMCLALISELIKFNEINKNFTNLLLFGSTFIGLNLIMGICMFLKYVNIKDLNKSVTL